MFAIRLVLEVVRAWERERQFKLLKEMCSDVIAIVTESVKHLQESPQKHCTFVAVMTNATKNAQPQRKMCGCSSPFTNSR